MPRRRIFYFLLFIHLWFIFYYHWRFVMLKSSAYRHGNIYEKYANESKTRISPSTLQVLIILAPSYWVSCSSCMHTDTNTNRDCLFARGNRNWRLGVNYGHKIYWQQSYWDEIRDRCFIARVRVSALESKSFVKNKSFVPLFPRDEGKNRQGTTQGTQDEIQVTCGTQGEMQGRINKCSC